MICKFLTIKCSLSIQNWRDFYRINVVQFNVKPIKGVKHVEEFPNSKKRCSQTDEIDERVQYTDHLTEIIRQAEKRGDFDNLPGKGKPLHLDRSYFTNPYERQMHKTMKDNHVLPHWIKLGKEIDQEKETLATLHGKAYMKKVKYINKKIKEYNYACPPSLQRNKLQ